MRSQRHLVLYLLTIFTLFITGCAQPVGNNSTSLVPISPAPSPTPTFPPPTSTPPPPTPTLTPEQVPEITISKSNGNVISAQWNRGEIRTLSWLDNKNLLSVATNGYFIYDIKNKQEYSAKNPPVYSVDVDSSGNTILVVDKSNGKTISTLESSGNLLALVYYIDPKRKLIASFEDNKVYLWEIASGKRLNDLEVDFFVEGIDFNHEGNNLLVTGGTFISVWDLTNFKMIWQESGLFDLFSAHAFSPDGSLLGIVGRVIPPYGNLFSAEPVLYIVELEKNAYQRLPEFSVPELNRINIQFSADSKYIYATIGKNFHKIDVIQLIKVNSRELPRYVEQFSLNSDNTLLAFTDDNILEIWDMEQDIQVLAFSGYSSSPNSIDFSLDYTQVLSVINGRLQIFSIQSFDSIFDNSYENEFTALFGPNNNILIREMTDEVSGWTYADDKILWTIKGELISYSNDRSNLFIKQESETGESEVTTALVVDSLTGKIIFQKDISNSCGENAQMEHQLLAVAEEAENGNKISIFNTDTGELIAEINDGDCSDNMDFSPDGNLLAFRSSYLMKVMDIYTQDLITEFGHGHSNFNFLGMTSPTGTPLFISNDILVTTGGGLLVNEEYIWEISSGKQIGSIPEKYYGTNFSEDGNLLFSSKGEYVFSYSLPLNEVKDIFYTGHSDSISTFLISPDNKYLLSGSYDGTVIFQSLE